MSIEEIRSRISVINAETARLNTQRNQNIGRQQTLTKQLNDAFALYKKNYGIDLTTDNLQSELDSVTKKKEEELSKIEQILSLISTGNIAEANRLAGVVPSEVVPTPEVATTPEVVPPTTETSAGVVSPTVLPPVSTLEAVPPTYEIPVVPPVAPPIAPPVAPPIAPPVAPPSDITPPKPSPVLTGAESLEMGMSALEGFSKPSLGSLATPTPSNDGVSAPPKTPVQDFSAILNGTAFKPN